MKLNLLPQELIDEIFKYTDLQTVINYPHSSNYIIKYMTNKEKKYLECIYEKVKIFVFSCNYLLRQSGIGILSFGY